MICCIKHYPLKKSLISFVDIDQSNKSRRPSIASMLYAIGRGVRKRGKLWLEGQISIDGVHRTLVDHLINQSITDRFAR